MVSVGSVRDGRRRGNEPFVDGFSKMVVFSEDANRYFFEHFTAKTFYPVIERGLLRNRYIFCFPT